MSICHSFRVSKEDEKIVERFKRFVRDKYGKVHTVFGKEIINAMKLFLDYQKGNCEIWYNKENETPFENNSVCVQSNDHINYIYANFPCTYEFPEYAFVEWCLRNMEIRTERTAKSYLKTMLKKDMVHIVRSTPKGTFYQINRDSVK